MQGSLQAVEDGKGICKIQHVEVAKPGQVLPKKVCDIASERERERERDDSFISLVVSLSSLLEFCHAVDMCRPLLAPCSCFFHSPSLDKPARVSSAEPQPLNHTFQTLNTKPQFFFGAVFAFSPSRIPCADPSSRRLSGSGGTESSCWSSFSTRSSYASSTR